MSAFHLTSILASLSSEACLQNQSRLHETLRAYAQTWTRNLGGRPTPIARSAGSRFFRHQALPKSGIRRARCLPGPPQPHFSESPICHSAKTKHLLECERGRKTVLP